MGKTNNMKHEKKPFSNNITTNTGKSRYCVPFFTRLVFNLFLFHLKCLGSPFSSYIRMLKHEPIIINILIRVQHVRQSQQFYMQ